MKSILTGTVAAFVLGAAIASSQTPPPAGQAPAGAKPSDEQAQPAGQTEPGQRTATAKPQTSTHRGILKGSATTGWTISPIGARSAATSTAGATATAGGADALTYSVVAADPSKVNLESMADQCVEIVGVLAPETAAAKPGADAPASPGAAAARTRTLTVATIKEVEGGCK